MILLPLTGKKLMMLKKIPWTNMDLSRRKKEEEFDDESKTRVHDNIFNKDNEKVPEENVKSKKRKNKPRGGKTSNSGQPDDAVVVSVSVETEAEEENPTETDLAPKFVEFEDEDLNKTNIVTDIEKSENDARPEDLRSKIKLKKKKNQKKKEEIARLLIWNFAIEEYLNIRNF